MRLLAPVLQGSLIGVAVGALASLVVVALIVSYLLRNDPDVFLAFRKLDLRERVEEDDGSDYD